MRSTALALVVGLATASGAGAGELRLQAVRPEEVSALDARIDAMLRQGGLRPKYVRDDALLPGRRHERLLQYHEGVRVWGAEVTRQRSLSGTSTIFGAVYEGIPDLDPRPTIPAERARALAGDRAGAVAAPNLEPELFVFPAEDGSFALAWRVGVFDGAHMWASFIDAHTGRELLRYDDLQTQTATVAVGTGVLGDRKKMSVTLENGTYYAADGLRPPSIITYDGRGDLGTGIRLVNGAFQPGLADAGQHSGTEWPDGPTLDAHTYAGWTYDYFFKVHNRRGLDGADLPMRSVVNPARKGDFLLYVDRFSSLFINAAWNTFTLSVFYGVGTPIPVDVGLGPQLWEHLAGSLDVVSHELTHGVTQFSSSLIYRNESGALNEAFSDIMSIAVQFHYKYASANYIVGDEVVTPGGLRSMANPVAYGDPDHYSVRFLGTQDNGGVHINSSIVNHAFYLAVEGGTNRVSQRRVEGVGAAQRDKVEKAFFRAFTRMLTPSSNFSNARAATIQSASDLFGPADASVRAITQAWDAVGVN